MFIYYYIYIYTCRYLIFNNILPHLQCITNIETEQCTTQHGKGRKQDSLKKENCFSSKYEREESASDAEEEESASDVEEEENASDAEEDERATKKLGQHPSAKKQEKVHLYV